MEYIGVAVIFAMLCCLVAAFPEWFPWLTR